MVLVFFFLLMLGPSFSQSLLCDPAIEKACYSAVCSNDSYVPRTPEALGEKLKTVPLSAENTTKLGEFRKSMNSQLKKLSEVTPKSIQDNARYMEADHLMMMMRDQIVWVNGEAILNELGMDPDFPLKDAQAFLKQHVGLSQPLMNFRNAVDSQKPSVPRAEDLKYLDQVWASADDVPDKQSDVSLFKGKLSRGEVLTDKDIQSISSLIKDYNKNQMRKMVATGAKILSWKINHLRTQDWSKKFMTVEDSCRTMTYLATKMRETSTKENKEKYIKEVLSGFESKFLPLLSKSSAKALKKRINKKSFEIGQVVDAPKFVFKQNEPTSLSELVRFTDMMNGASCDFSGTLDDRYTPGKKRVDISPLSLILKPGAFVLGHELGHFIEFALLDHGSPESKAKLATLMKCFDGFHPQEKYKKNSEDFGDWFAATIGVKDAAVMCEIRNMMDLKMPSVRSTYASDPFETHSNDLFRALHIKMVGGDPIPESCKDLMDQNLEKPEKCSL